MLLQTVSLRSVLRPVQRERGRPRLAFDGWRPEKSIDRSRTPGLPDARVARIKLVFVIITRLAEVVERGEV